MVPNKNNIIAAAMALLAPAVSANRTPSRSGKEKQNARQVGNPMKMATSTRFMSTLAVKWYLSFTARRFHAFIQTGLHSPINGYREREVLNSELNAPFTYLCGKHGHVPGRASAGSKHFSESGF